MNKRIGLLLVVYSLLLGGLSYLIHRLAPAVGQPTLIAGVAGGTLCLLWGIRAITGRGGKALPILTLIPVSFVLLSQTFMSWSGAGRGLQAGRTVAMVITLLLVLSLVMLVRIAWSGVVFDVPANGPKKGAGAKGEGSGKRASG